MVKMLWFLLKAFVAIFLVAAFAKFMMSYLGLGFSIPTDPFTIIGGVWWGFLGSIFGLSAGLIWGEENARSSYKKAQMYNSY